MGQDAYRVEYHRTNIPRNYEWFDLLKGRFDSDNGETWIILEDFNEWVQEKIENGFDFQETFKEEIEATRKLLDEQKDKSMELSFG